MPAYPSRQCSRTGCTALTHDGTGRCAAHPKQAWAQTGSSADRGYGWTWQQLRLVILKRDGYRCQCLVCRATNALKPAHEVDHIRSKANGGTDDPSNLQAINRDCHARKTQAERIGRDISRLEVKLYQPGG